MKKTVILLVAFFFGIAPLLAQMQLNVNNIGPTFKLKLNQIGVEIYKAGKLDHTTLQKWKALVLEIHKKGECDWNSLIQFIVGKIKLKAARESYFYKYKYDILKELRDLVRNQFQYLRSLKAQFSMDSPGTVFVRTKNLNIVLTIRKNISGLQFSNLKIFNKFDDKPRSNLASGDIALIENAFKMEGSSFSGKDIGGIISDAMAGEVLPVHPSAPGQLNALLKECKDSLQDCRSDCQKANGDFQKMLKQQQQTIRRMHQVSKLLHDSAQAVIRNAG